MRRTSRGRVGKKVKVVKDILGFGDGVIGYDEIGYGDVGREVMLGKLKRFR